MRKDQVQIGVYLTKALRNRLQKTVDRHPIHQTISGFVREAILDKINGKPK